MLSPLRLLYRHRSKLLSGVRQDVRQRYVGSVLGTAWLVLFPLAQLVIYATLYSLIFKIQPQGLTQAGYVLLVFSGLVPLMTFNDTLGAAMNSLNSHKEVVRYTLFPMELLAVRAALSAQIMGLTGLLTALMLSCVLGSFHPATALLIPVFWCLLILFAVGLGWLLSLLTLIAQDVQQVVSLVIMTLFALSPFAYTKDMVPEGLKALIYFNPLSYFVLTFQPLAAGNWPPLFAASGAVVLGLGTFTIGFKVFRRAKSVFLDYA